MKTSNFSNLLRNFEEKFTECNWNMANGGFSLAEEILEQIKLVGDMEQVTDIGFVEVKCQ